MRRRQKQTDRSIDKSLFTFKSMMRAGKDLDLLLDFIVEESANIVNADTASFFLYDERTNELWSKVALDINETLRFNVKHGIAGEVFKSGKSINVKDAYKHKKFNPAIDKNTGYKTKTLLCVPVKNIEGKSIGVLQALNKIESEFTSEDEEILEIFASNAAVAIENAKLINELEDSNSFLQQENKVLRETGKGKFFINNFVGTSPKITEIVRIIEKIAKSPLDILITGESGTGKELAARMIHFNSDRSKNAFVDLNCAALPDSILESELFGIEKGVATGVDPREGKIELANSGTLFLDEIGDMSLSAQAKLLRALQERKITRLGGKKEIKVDFRVVAATNKDLKEGIKDKAFREDLFYRLNVVHIKMPALREIKQDIPVIANHFLDNYAEEFGKSSLSFSNKVLSFLEKYSWPGNVRELENEIKRLTILSEGNVIKEQDISQHIIDQTEKIIDFDPLSGNDSRTMKEIVEDIEIRMIKDALLKNGGNKQRTSEMLGITRQGLFKKMKRYCLS